MRAAVALNAPTDLPAFQQGLVNFDRPVSDVPGLVFILHGDAGTTFDEDYCFGASQTFRSACG